MSQYANFVLAELKAAVLAGAETIDVGLKAPGELPVSPFPDRQRLLLVDDLRRPTKFEIISYMRLENLVGFNVRLLNVERGLDGTTAQAWSIGDCATNDLFASQFLPLGEEDSGDDDVLTFVQGGGLALRQVSAEQLTDATPGNPILLVGTGANPPTSPGSGEAHIVYWTRTDDSIRAFFDNGTNAALVIK